jgi:hypothetical protein
MFLTRGIMGGYRYDQGKVRSGQGIMVVYGLSHTGIVFQEVHW